MIKTKVCIKCCVEKDIKEFYLRKDTGKYRNLCKNVYLVIKENLKSLKTSVYY